MAVADTVFEQKTMRVATSGQSAILYVQHHRGVPVAIRPFYSDLPRSVWKRSARTQIATEIDQERYRAASHEKVISPIDSVLLTDAAEVDLHAVRNHQG